jgi:hypothetical protein
MWNKNTIHLLLPETPEPEELPGEKYGKKYKDSAG